jgi:phthalate 4,5-dioxygenase
MLRPEDNRFLTESGAGTGMGELIRRFWVPVLLSEELPEADGEPKKVTVMGEELLAFRDTRGVVGLIDQYCPHRGANLWFGRNEECGIRCVYHGWKFDTDGQCVDMPTSYPDLNAKDKMKIKSYPVREWGDMIWAYMGSKEVMPELPALEMATLPPEHRYVSKKWQDCNWVQAMEGSIDTAHFTFVHLGFEKEENEILDIKKHFINPLARMRADQMRWIAEDARPVIRILPHDAGLTIAGARGAGPDNYYWRIAQYLMPVHSYAPSAMPGEPSFGQTFIPVNDTSCWIYCYAWNPDAPLTAAQRESYKNGNGIFSINDANYVPLRNRSNNYLIDRKLQRTKSYTGIQGVSEQDAAVQDSQGPIADRSIEHLGPTDLGLLHFRKLVMDAARALQQGIEPEHAKRQDRYTVRSGGHVTSRSKDLPEVMVERFGDVAGFVAPKNAGARAAE